MTWQDRIYSEITLTSPVGTVYHASWQGGPRDAEKSLGIFKSPGIAGAIVQDLERGAVVYTLTLMFSGPDHDVVSERFFNECGSTKGIWKVNHPTKGILNLQLISYSEAIEPVLNANITTFTTEWIEPRVSAVTTDTTLIQSKTMDGIDQITASSSNQVIDNLNQNTFENQLIIKSRTEQVLNILSDTISSIVSVSDEIKSASEFIRRQIIKNINAPIIAINELTRQIWNLVRYPVMGVGNIRQTSLLYENFIDRVMAATPEKIVDPTRLGDLTRNQAVLDEIFVISAMGAIIDITVNGELTTRKQTVEIINGLNNQFQTVTDMLDEYQEQFETDLAPAQYFSQSQSYIDSANAVSLAIRYLIMASFGLKIEKRITLTQNKTPAFITIEEYGSLGENDSNLNFFIESNDLKANDIMLLHTGREILIYE